MTLRIGGLFEGYGGLTRGVQDAMGGELAWYSEIDPGGSSRDEAIADHAQELAGAGLLATTPPTPNPLRMAHEYGVKQRAALLDRAQETACDRRSTTPPTQPAAEVVTEHAREMSGGGMHVRADYPEIENVYPLKDYIVHGQQHGGSVWRRQVVVVEDWTKVPPAADVKPGAETFQSPTENESPPLHVLPLVEFKHKTEGGMCCNGKHHMCGGPGSYCCSQTVYMHRHTDGSTGPISTSPLPAPTENESGRVDRTHADEEDAELAADPMWQAAQSLRLPAGLGGGQTKEDPPLSSTTDKD